MNRTGINLILAAERLPNTIRLERRGRKAVAVEIATGRVLTPDEVAKVLGRPE